MESDDELERLLTRLILKAFPLAQESNKPPVDVDRSLWHALANAAQQQGVASLLYAALRITDRLDELPDDIAQELRSTYQHTRITNAVAYRELARVLTLLEAQRVPVLVLKGAALAVSVYPEIGLRPFGDLDLLIPRAQASQVMALLAEQGYTSAPQMARDFAQQFSSEQTLYQDAPSGTRVDLHWHLFTLPYYIQHIPIEWFWQRTSRFEIGDVVAHTLNPSAQILYLSAHSTLHHSEPRLIWLYDLARLLTIATREIDWDEVLSAAQKFHLALALQRTLPQVQELWQVSIPVDAAARLHRLMPTFNERVALALTSSPDGEARVLFDGLSTPGITAKLRFWRAQLFPNATYMRTRYQIKHSALLPFYYLYRATTAVSQVARSALSIVLRRSTVG